jgi:hypothetical protein
MYVCVSFVRNAGMASPQPLTPTPMNVDRSEGAPQLEVNVSLPKQRAKAWDVSVAKSPALDAPLPAEQENEEPVEA